MLHVDESRCGSMGVEVSIIHKFLLVHRRPELCCIDSNEDWLYPRVTISAPPDDVLLEIFVVYVVSPQVDYYFTVAETGHHEDGWCTLVHVCRRWRSVVLASPRRLDLQLLCTNTRRVKKLLDIWPPFPICIYAFPDAGKSSLRGVANLMAALKQQNRVRCIYINGVPNSLLRRFVPMPFPALTILILTSNNKKAPVLPDSFLGGSAPRLRTISLSGIPFPGLRKLLFSTTDLVRLFLDDIPHSGCISPEAMVASLSTLTRLEKLCLQFRSPRSRAVRENRHPPPLTRVVLPALTRLQFKGDSE
jgi:F-box-like